MAADTSPDTRQGRRSGPAGLLKFARRRGLLAREAVPDALVLREVVRRAHAHRLVAVAHVVARVEAVVAPAPEPMLEALAVPEPMRAEPTIAVLHPAVLGELSGLGRGRTIRRAGDDARTECQRGDRADHDHGLLD